MQELINELENLNFDSKTSKVAYALGYLESYNSYSDFSPDEVADLIMYLENVERKEIEI